MSDAKRRVEVESIESIDAAEAFLWVSCHGFESRSIAHLRSLPVEGYRRVSIGFLTAGQDASAEQLDAIQLRRATLRHNGFDTPVVDDVGFEQIVKQELLHAPSRNCRVIADISSMSRSRIASLFLSCHDVRSEGGCVLDLVYFPATHSSHKHAYEPLEYFGPCHHRLAGWPDDPDLPLSLVVGLGTEPRRADGIVEFLEPDILALCIPLGDEPQYVDEVRRENRRLLEVRGEPRDYPVRDPSAAFVHVSAIATQLAQRSRVVIVPLGPKIFCATSIAAALTIGSHVGVWKASAGSGVAPVDVQAVERPVLARFRFCGCET